MISKDKNISVWEPVLLCNILTYDSCVNAALGSNVLVLDNFLKLCN